MKLIGYLIGIVWLGLAYGAFRTSSAGWSQGHSDIGFWWAVIGTLLAIAALGAMVGTAVHSRSHPSH
jgi:hypothetical protein